MHVSVYLAPRAWPLMLAAAVVGLFASVGLCEPPAMDISSAGAGGSLSPADTEKVDARIRYWVSQALQAANERDIMQARSALVGDYNTYSSGDFQYIFVARSAAAFVPALDGIAKNDKLGDVRRTNLALAMSQMYQVTIQPALERMVRDANPAVRYLGWEGYRGIRALVLAQGQQFTQRFVASLRAAAAGEKSPQVIGSILHTMTLPPVPPGGVGEAELKAVQDVSWQLLSDNWQRWCLLVKEGDVEMAVAAPKALRACQSFFTIFAQDKDRQNATLQRVVDMMWCAAEAYDAARANGPVAEANAVLLREAEAIVKGMVQSNRSFLAESLGNANVADRGAAVKLAALSWLDELAARGITKPQVEPPATTTAPATPN